jgi:hypothetical protein
MKVLNYGVMAAACAVSVTLSVLALFLYCAWLLSGASLVQSMALTALSVSGSGLIALIECRLQ